MGNVHSDEVQNTTEIVQAESQDEALCEISDKSDENKANGDFIGRHGFGPE